ncbi:Protein kinase, putative [Hondaea fermentalgiana]|uniref:Protein kinase, putative n=1 Tax=Hondaea fermentalgiana TaxID=2315210 RepID=A0A2R5GLF3_9STRA|nr:Protein kinase, putative [Hondaea fermentalgiana]|eukprot:GBG29453.1 Protein kinase, putative [Hondaea fermentalgiana]
MGTNLCKVDQARDLCVDFERTSFARGEYKRAFRGVERGSEDRVVVKAYADRWRAAQDLDVDVRMHKEAHALAVKFNALKLPATREIVFVEPRRAHVVITRPCSGLAPGDRVTVEPELVGHYQKFLSNNGTFARGHSSLTAFAHWTFHHTKGAKMVVDLQGVKTKDGYVLTDPAIHSRDGRYGDLDLSTIGMQAFFANHKCTHACRGLRRPSGGVKSGVDDCEKIMRDRLVRAKSSSRIVMPAPSGALRYQ